MRRRWWCDFSQRWFLNQLAERKDDEIGETCREHRRGGFLCGYRVSGRERS